MNTESLRHHLVAATRFDAEYDDGLSSHLPMALVALTRLGAGEARLAAYAARYSARLHDAPPPAPWPAGEAWRAQLGDPRAWPAYRSLWRDWFAHEGADEVLEQALPTLIEGAGAAAFHGLIRTAYAITANHADELADALAYWACRWFPCGGPGVPGRSDDPAPVLATLEAPHVPPARLIAQAIALAAAQPSFALAVARWCPGVATLPALARQAAERYAGEGGFTALHLVTASHALQVLLPWLGNGAAREAAAGHFGVAFAAAWATLGPRKASHRGATPAVRPWTDLVARAVASDDEHVVKLVDSAQQLERLHGGTVWQRAAARAVTIGA